MDVIGAVEARQRHPHYPNLDYLRLSLALLVLIGHCWQRSVGKVDPLGHALGANAGWFGVNAFFALSGFLILQSRERSGSAGSFLWRRFLRIYPGFQVCLAAVAIALRGRALRLRRIERYYAWESARSERFDLEHPL